MKTGWCLFLDRDGVINELLPMDYVKTWEEFVFRDQVIEEIASLTQLFDHIFIITNQQGIGKSIMGEDDLENIHQKMLQQINNAGGIIRKIYYCPHLSESQCDCRKPKPGMIKQALREFESCIPAQSILIGDSISDIELAHNMNMYSVAMIHPFNKNQVLTIKPQFMIDHLSELRTTVLPVLPGFPVHKFA